MDLLAYFNTVRDIEIQLIDHKTKSSKRKGYEVKLDILTMHYLSTFEILFGEYFLYIDTLKGDEKAKFETFFTEMYRRYAIDLFEVYIKGNAEYDCYVYIKKFYEIVKTDK